MKIRFDFEGPTSWFWSYLSPEDELSMPESYSVRIASLDSTHWRWSVTGLYKNIDPDDLSGRGNSMQACIDAVVALFKRVGLDIEIPLPISN